MTGEMKILTIIPARGGSKGIHQKNIRSLAGKPLIGWTIEAALSAQTPQRVIVSTDDAIIAQVARSLGAEVPFLRPAEFATDTAKTLDVVMHALDWLEREENFIPDAILLLQPTSPLRTSEDIDVAVGVYQRKAAAAVVSVCEVQHPVEWLKRIGPDQELLPWQTGPQITRRQDGEPLVQLNGALYLVSSSALLHQQTFTPDRTFAYVMPPERSIDIDSLWEFHVAELILGGSDAIQRD